MTKDQAITKLFCECPKLNEGREGLIEALVVLGLLKIEDWPKRPAPANQEENEV